MVELLPSKQVVPVRFWSMAPWVFVFPKKICMGPYWFRQGVEGLVTRGCNHLTGQTKK